MKNSARVLFFLLFCLLPGTAKAGGGYGETGPYRVETFREIWTDAGREREVPVKAYYPVGVKDAPVIVFSHGLGGSRDNYEYLGRHWASHGFVSLHLQHHGSDMAVWKDKPKAERFAALKAAITDINVILDRPDDVSFAMTQVEERVRSGSHPLARVADAGNLAVAGHSFGAFTTMAVAGQNFATPAGRFSFGDPRARAAIAMSPNKPRRDQDFEGVYADIRIPVFHMTGTKDTSPVTPSVKAQDRLVPYRRTSHPETHLLVLEGGDHMVFSGFRWGQLLGRPGPESDQRFHELIRAGSTAFWKAYLQQDAAALNWLANGGYEQALGSDGAYSNKRVEKAKAKNTGQTP
ncbi:MAG: hypothetical protein AAGK14_01725 [Verrucomicrobiota bacterium]